MSFLEQGEKILYTARKHWFILASETVFIAFLALLPALFLFAPHLLPRELLRTITELIHFEGSLTLSVLFLWTLELIVLCIVFFIFWTDHFLDVWLITNMRIIAIEQRGMFNRNISTFRLDVIQDATVKVPGLIATLLRFGTVEISTASNESFKFRGAAHPNEVKERIMSEHHRVRA